MKKGMKPEVIIHSFLFMQTVIFLRSHDFLLTSGVIRCHLRPAMCSHTYIYTCSNGRGPEMRGRQIEKLLLKKKKRRRENF